jgi:Xaa-Pro aminopeptidase
VPDALLLLDASQHHSILFLPGQNKEAARWEGSRLLAGPEARSQTGIDEVLELSRFEAELDKRKNALQGVYVPFSPEEIAATSRDRALQHDSARQTDPWDGRPSRESAFENSLQAKLGPSVSIKDLSPLLDEMRRVKDSQEIERLRIAGHIGALGLKEAIRSAKPGMYEYQVAALAEFVFSWHGAAGPAFYPIVGSGPNSCLLHYSQNSRTMAAGDIVVLDFGPDYQYYQSDITRTFPISGRFSEEQAKLYQIVLAAQRAALGKVRPGASFGALNEAVQEVLEHYGYAKYLAHGVSHYVGMSVHDVGASKAFEPGVVIAVEPGIYMPDKNLGIRIEDTVLVTKDGYEVLTKAAPTDIIEIEKLMSEKGMGEAIKD